MPTKVPMTLILGFYVSQIFNRWWDQVKTVIACWPDRFMLQVTLLLQGNSAKIQQYRRAFVRLANLANVVTWRDISPRVRKRFPTTRHLVDAGLMTADERDVFDKL